MIRAAGVAREQLIDQLVRSVRLLQHDKATEVLVQLKPDFLGRLSVRILVDKHGMTIEIKAGNEAVRQVMQDSLADLQQRLSEKGIAFDQLSVFADTGSNPREEPAWPNEASIVRRESEEKLAAETPLERAPAVKSGKIDYLA
jgi:flagellar hook-length control protein FliK